MTENPTIWLDEGPGEQIPYRLDLGSTIVGRQGDVDVPISSDLVSGHHAELYWDGERLRIRDLGSRNGTSVNDQPVVDWIDLRDADVIRFGTVKGVITAGSGVGVQVAAPATDHIAASTPSVAPGSRLSQVPIFISHSSEDKRAARAVASYLRHRGWTVWIDEAGIEGGKNWRSELIQALEGTWVVVLLVSLQSMQSRWVTREIEAADRLGLQVIPLVIDEAPFPDSLRMILSGVQQIDATGIHDSEKSGQQLARLDSALIRAAQQVGRSRPGRVRVVVGTIIGTIGMIGALVGFALFVYLGFLAVNSGSLDGGGIPPPLYGFGLMFVSIIVGGIGEGIRRSGLKKGI